LTGLAANINFPIALNKHGMYNFKPCTKQQVKQLRIYHFILALLIFLVVQPSHAQLITGYWKGKIDRKNVELKIIKKGDSLTGTSYYYESANNYRRYTIKGYFDKRDNSVVWWDDQLVEEKNGRKNNSGKKEATYFSNADFNCPGGTRMFLNGMAALRQNQSGPTKPVALEKSGVPLFNDEWNFIIDNYTVGANDPVLIDSIARLAFNQPTANPPALTPLPAKTITFAADKKGTSGTVSTKVNSQPVTSVPPNPSPVISPVTNQQRLQTRSRKLMQEIPVSGDSVQLRFYDNAEVDGDSIAIFLNNKLLYEHVLLSDKPYIIKLAVTELEPVNELVMVAENLGSIPPNTSLMVADIEDKHYEARLESTEQSSAVIRFVKR